MSASDQSSEDTFRKTLAAAVLAVQRGVLSADGASELLDGSATPGPGAASPDIAATIARLNPAARVHALTQELEALMRDPQWQESAFSGLGLDEEQRASLASLRAGDVRGLRAAKQTLSELARAKLSELRDRLPLSGAERYKIEREFARGGMGRILIARDTAVGRDVALKEVLSGPQGTPLRGAKDASEEEPELVERFLREAKITGQLEHPGIVPVYEISRRPNGSIFYTMRLVRGTSMADRLAAIESMDLPPARKLVERLKLLDAFVDICHAVAYAHSQGVIHRDLKPDNIMLGDFGETVLLDWGLARVRGEEVEAETPKPRFSESLMGQVRELKTLDGAIMGTPGYMSPEQARGRIDKVDERSDVYALGAILYQLLSGRRPYEGLSPLTVVEQVQSSDPEPLHEAAPDAPADLVTLAEKAMARDREQRLASATALAREITAFRDGRTLSVYQYSSAELLRRFVRRNRLPVGVVAAALLVLSAVIVWSLVSISEERDQATGALALAQHEQAERQALEERQRREREGLIRERGTRIEAQQARLGAFDAALPLAQELLSSCEDGRLSEARRPEAARVVSSLLESATARTELVRLALEPIAGRSEQLLPASELHAQEGALLNERLAAARLAAASGDFFLAELILADTRGPKARIDEVAEEVSAGRTALERQRVARTEQLFGLIRDGVDDRGGSVNTVRVQDYIIEVGGWRENYVVELMRSRLERLTELAMSEPPGTVWNVRRRMEIQFITGVLLQMGLPTRSVAPLAELMRALSDEELVIELGITLCRLESPLAWRPLAELMQRYGDQSLVWLRVRRYFWRVPEPADLPEPTTAEECLVRARLCYANWRAPDPGGHRSRDRTAEKLRRLDDAVTWLERALELDPRHEASWRLLSLVRWYTWDGSRDASLADVGRLLEINPRHAGAIAWKARLAQFVPQRATEAEIARMYDEAIELAPDDFEVRERRCEYRLQVINRYEEGEHDIARDSEGALADAEELIRIAPRRPESYALRASALIFGAEDRKSEALNDLARAIDLDPENSRYWLLRAHLHRTQGGLDAAVRDLTHAITLAPSNISAYGNRVSLRIEMKDLHGALADSNAMLEVVGDTFPPARALRGQIYELLGDKRAALADYRYYVNLRPEFAGNESVLKQIAQLEAELGQEHASGE